MKKPAKFYFQITASSGVPIYRQLIDQVKTLIATGRLEDGVFLPSVRQVSKELEVNPMTVSKSYSLLEKEGVLEFVRGQGMRVQKPGVSKNDMKQRQKDIVPLLKEVVTKTNQLSLKPEQVIEMLNGLWKESTDE